MTGMFKRKPAYPWVLDELLFELVIARVVLKKFRYPQIQQCELEARRVLRKIATDQPELRWAREWVADHVYAVQARLTK
jgi:hypothetical protein